MPARMVLYFLSLSGFLVSFVMRNDINIAIVAMVEQSSPLEVSNSTSVSCFVVNVGTNLTMVVSNEQVFVQESIRC